MADRRNLDDFRNLCFTPQVLIADPSRCKLGVLSGIYFWPCLFPLFKVEEMTGPVAPHSGRVLRLFPKSLCKFYAESAVRTVAFMVCDFYKSVAVAGLLDQRYTVRYPFSVTAEILELETGPVCKA